MEMRKALLLAAAALSAACAGARKDLGEVQVRTTDPIISTQLFNTVNFHVEQGRLFVTDPYTPFDFDVVVMPENGCLRGAARRAQLYFCSKGKLDTGAQAWTSVSGTSLFFFTQLRDEGRTLEIESGPFRAVIQLGASPADDELRAHPELIGAAFALRLLPASKNAEGSDSAHREWKYILTKR
jgi:hypothetical protein